jgi:protein TonB
MTSGAYAGTHLAAAVVATAMTAASCGEVPNPAPRTPVVAVKNEVPEPAPRSPVAGVKFEAPRRKKAMRLSPPPAPKGQRREADIPVRLDLDETGKVVTVKILKESQYPELNEAVRRAAMEEEFTPAMRDGVPIAYSISFAYRFRVED